MPGALILAATALVEIVLILAILRRREGRTARALPNLLILAALLLLPIAVGLALGRLTRNVVSTVAWQFVFSGFGEEILYRGYVQSRVNQEFGRPYQFMGARFGPGLFVAAFIFGLSHVLNTFNPFTGSYELAWWWGLWTLFGGLFFGLVREKTGSLLAPGVAHGLPDAVGESFATLFGWQL
jgi:membrane protease YdiL (CAAX protease family)